MPRPLGDRWLPVSVCVASAIAVAALAVPTDGSGRCGQEHPAVREILDQAGAAYRALPVPGSHAAIAASRRASSGGRRVRAAFAADPNVLIIEAPSGRRRADNATGAATRLPIRIALLVHEVSTTTRFCTAPGDKRPTFTSATGTAACSASDVLTAAKRAALIGHILPRAAAVVAAALLVDRFKSPLVLPRSVPTCPGVTVPEAMHDGVPVDYVFFVTAGATGESGSRTIAWAAHCNTVRGRPVIGIINYNPAFVNPVPFLGHTAASAEAPPGVPGFSAQLVPGQTPLAQPSPWLLQEPVAAMAADRAWGGHRSAAAAAVEGSVVLQVATAVHEMVHALGFNKAFLSQQSTQATFRGKTATVFTGPKAVAAAREHFGCSDLPGPELEDEGGAGSAGAHWDRRTLPYELMAPSGGFQFSPLTLAALEDFGFYSVAPGVAMPMDFARGAGCAAVTERCETLAGGREVEWCFPRPAAAGDAHAPAGAKAGARCTSSGASVAACSDRTYDEDLPAAFQHFPDEPSRGGDRFFDYCPARKAQMLCNAAGTLSAARSGATGAVRGALASTRCFEVEGLHPENTPAADAADLAECFAMECLSATALRVRVGSGHSNWAVCNTTGVDSGANYGALVDVPAGSGFIGKIRCPVNVSKYCDSRSAVNRNSYGLSLLVSTECPGCGQYPPLKDPTSASVALTVRVLLLFAVASVMMAGS